MTRFSQIFPLLALAALCSLGGWASRTAAQPARPAVPLEVSVRAADTLAAEAAQRLTSDPWRGLPVVVRASGSDGTDAAVAELLRTRLLERGIAVEIACPARCVELALLTTTADAAGATRGAPPGQLLPLTSVVGTADGRAAAGRGAALLVTFAVRDGNRYSARSHSVVLLAGESR